MQRKLQIDARLNLDVRAAVKWDCFGQYSEYWERHEKEIGLRREEFVTAMEGKIVEQRVRDRIALYARDFGIITSYLRYEERRAKCRG